MTQLTTATGRRWAAVVAVTALTAVLVGCGGSSSSPPKSLSLSGEKVPLTEVTGAYSQMCAVAKQAQTDPSGAATSFATAENGLEVLATVLNKDHSQESQRLLAAIATYIQDIGTKPPVATSGQAATNLVATAKQGLVALKVTPPAC